MLWFSNNNAYPIGIDIGEDDIKIAQLFVENKSIHLMAGGSVARPMDVNPGSSLWPGADENRLRRGTRDDGGTIAVSGSCPIPRLLAVFRCRQLVTDCSSTGHVGCRRKNCSSPRLSSKASALVAYGPQLVQVTSVPCWAGTSTIHQPSPCF